MVKCWVCIGNNVVGIVRVHELPDGQDATCNNITKQGGCLTCERISKKRRSTIYARRHSTSWEREVDASIFCSMLGSIRGLEVRIKKLMFSKCHLFCYDSMK